MPLEYWRWHIAREFGWTLAQVDALSLADLDEYFQVSEGLVKAREQEAKVRQRGGKGSKSIR
jgi:hypothetical protein